MSKATVVPATIYETESLIGFKSAGFYLDVAPLIWSARLGGDSSSKHFKALPVPLVVVHVSCVDWGGHPLFRRIARLYHVRFFWAGPWNDYVLTADDTIPHAGEISWSEALLVTRSFFVRGYRIWGEQSPLVSIINGGCCERICREIYATRPHFDLQGRGDGK